MRELNVILAEIETLRKELDETLVALKNKCDYCDQLAAITRLQNIAEMLMSEVYTKAEKNKFDKLDGYEKCIIAAYEHSEKFKELIVSMVEGADMSEYEKVILKARFFDGFTLAKAGDILGVTKERARQLEGKALEKICHSFIKDAEKKFVVKECALEIPLNIYFKNAANLPLSVRTYNCLLRHGYSCTLDVVNGILDGSVISQMNFGKTSAREVLEWLRGQNVPDEILELFEAQIKKLNRR